MKISTFYLSCIGLWLATIGPVNRIAAQPENKPLNKPNVLFIIVDDMNKFFLTDYPVAKAPAIKKLASESYNFLNASCAAPVCIPSRASFFSGMYPHHSGVYRNMPDVWRTSPLWTHAWIQQSRSTAALAFTVIGSVTIRASIPQSPFLTATRAMLPTTRDYRNTAK